jgi:hypothetical protein
MNAGRSARSSARGSALGRVRSAWHSNAKQFGSQWRALMETLGTQVPCAGPPIRMGGVGIDPASRVADGSAAGLAAR